MEQYIPKSALVAWAKETYLCENASMIRKVCYKQLLEHLDTIEVKEVDLDEEITIAMPHRYSWSGDGSTMLYTEEQMKDFAKHFFELGLKAQKGEDI